MLLQNLVTLGEMSTAQEATMGRERRGMDTGQQVVLLLVHHGRLLLGRGAPQQEHHPRQVLGDPADDCIRHLLPSPVLVRVGLTLPDRETGVEQENTLGRPPSQVTVTRTGEAGDVSLQLLEHVEKTWRRSNTGLDGETETVSLTWTVIWILTEDDDLDTGDGHVLGP